MLLNKHKFAVGDIVTIKLISGDEIMGKFIEDAMGSITLDRPVMLAMTQKGPAMAPVLVTVNPDSKLTFNTQAITVMAESDAEIGKQYVYQTTGIQPVSALSKVDVVAVTFTSTIAILAIQATSLAAEATSAGLTSLATALTNLSTEITANSSITEQEFFGGGTTSFSGTGGTGGATPTGGSSSGTGTDKDSAAIVWANILDTAASIISAHNSNVAREIAVNNDSTQGIVSIAYSLGMIENSLGAISGHSNTIADKQTAMETHFKKIKELSEGNGIHTISPLEFINFISSYRYLIEGGEITSETEPLTEKQLDKARKRISDYLSKINDLPKAF